MARIWVYIDESGFGQKPVYVMAGFLATSQQWASFTSEWQKCLDTPPRIEFFHMDEAMGLDGEFRYWRESARDDKLRDLSLVISRHTHFGFTCSLLHDDYVAVADGVQPGFPWLGVSKLDVKKLLRSPYFYLLYSTISETVQWIDELSMPGEIDFVFDEQVMEKLKVLGAWEDFKHGNWVARGVKQRVGRMPSFQDDKVVRPLQAADMLAWVCRRRWLEQLQGLPVLALPHHPEERGRGLVRNFVWTADSLIDVVLSTRNSLDFNISASIRSGLGDSWIA
jgi:Protein of unknown function (DUF3800)